MKSLGILLIKSTREMFRVCFKVCNNVFLVMCVCVCVHNSIYRGFTDILDAGEPYNQGHCRFDFNLFTYLLNNLFIYLFIFIRA